MTCNASYARFIFGKFFHMNYNWICTPICTKILFLQKVGVTRLHHGTEGKGRLIPVSSTSPSCLLDLFLYSLFLFSHREGGGGMVGDHVGRCRLHRSDRQLYSPLV
jgi:hypothetical protein